MLIEITYEPITDYKKLDITSTTQSPNVLTLDQRLPRWPNI